MKKSRALILIALAGCVKPPEPPPSAPAGPAPTPSVVVARVVSQKLEKRVRAVGEIQAYRNVALHAKVQGYVEKILVDRGAEVKQGQLLVQLMAPELAAQRAEAEARLAGDDASYKRLKEASATAGVVAGNELDVALKNVEADRARVRVCAEFESYLRVAAPFDGAITERNAHEGSMVGPSTASPMLRLQELRKLRLVAAVPEVAAGGVTEGDSVKFGVPAFPGEPFTGTVARSARSLDARTRTLPVELDVDNASGRLAPGMFAEIQWPMKRAGPSLFVPAAAVAVTTERTFLLRIKGDAVEWVDVRVGASMGDLVEIIGDVKEGEVVAARGTDELKPGTKVAPKEPAPVR
jgi:RND family efflux transporter MFP subunit